MTAGPPRERPHGAPADRSRGERPAHAPYEDRIIEELDGRLAPDDREDLDRHLSECAECRRARAEYGAVFAAVRNAPAADGTAPPEFWDELARGIDERLAVAGPMESTAAAGRTLIDMTERARFRNGWAGVGGGLVAAGVAVVLLMSLYLTLPRGGPEPQAFTSPAQAARGSPELLRASDELLALASEVVGGPPGGDGLGALAPLGGGGRDPIADLVEAESELDDLSTAELEDLLATLESRT